MCMYVNCMYVCVYVCIHAFLRMYVHVSVQGKDAPPKQRRFSCHVEAPVWTLWTVSRPTVFWQRPRLGPYLLTQNSTLPPLAKTENLFCQRPTHWQARPDTSHFSCTVSKDAVLSTPWTVWCAVASDTRSGSER